MGLCSIYFLGKTRNANSGRQIPDLCKMTVDDINTCLCRFVMGVRKVNGELYPPDSLYLIMCGLLRKLRIHDKDFLGQSYPRFTYLRKTMDSEIENLTSKVALPQIETKPVTENDEERKTLVTFYIRKQNNEEIGTQSLSGLR